MASHSDDSSDKKQLDRKLPTTSTRISIDRVLDDFYEMLEGAGPSPMVKSLVQAMTKKNDIQATQLKLYVESLLDIVIDQIEILVEKEYVPALRSDFVSQKLEQMNQHIHQLGQLSEECRNQMKPLYQQIELLKEQLGNEKGKNKALTVELDTIRKTLATKGPRDIVSVKPYVNEIEELKKTVEKLERDKQLLAADLGKAKNENSALRERIESMKQQKDRISLTYSKCQTKLDKALEALSMIKGNAQPSGWFGASDALRRILSTTESILEEK